MFSMINEIAERVREGKAFTVDALHHDLIEGYSCAARDVHPSQHDAYFGYAQWFYRDTEYGGSNLLVRQCIWPDREGRLPWDEGYPVEALSTTQVQLWEPATLGHE